MSQISFQNSLTTRNITSPFTFDGEYVDITAYAEVNVLLQGTLPIEGDYYVVTAYLSNDRVNVLETIETNVTYPISNKLIKITPSANFIKIKLETFALDVITNFNMSTVLRSVLPLSSITNIDGIVSVSNFPASQVVTLASTEVSNFPASQVVTLASTEVSNFPATQSVSGTVAVTGAYQTTQPVSIATLPEISGSVAITNTFIYTREEPTTLTFHNNAGSNVGVVLFNGPRVLRALSITNTSTSIIYVHFYNMTTVPISGDTSIWLIPIAPNVVSNILNQTDHYFNVGISYRVTTTYNNDVSPAANVCFLNGTYGY